MINILPCPAPAKQARRQPNPQQTQMYYGRTWQNPQELKEAIATYIEFYNDHRIKISLDGLSGQVR
ncbi:hypothetical protein E4653_11150 [Corynebacterium diphtheriae subsp. lausannense]|nr:hypothetical protein E4653_11150 [Corynebacterium diphtheriae subsp. lausannense]